jgi:hypothetical protein
MMNEERLVLNSSFIIPHSAFASLRLLCVSAVSLHPAPIKIEPNHIPDAAPFARPPRRRV